MSSHTQGESKDMTEETCNDRLDYGRLPPRYRMPAGIDAAALPALLEHAWADFKIHNDPPGLRTRPWGAGWVFCCALVVEPTPGPRAVMVDDDGNPYTSQAEARAAAWGWHDRRHELCGLLEDGVWCFECGSDEAHVEAIDDKTCTQPWCTECDVEMGGLFDDLWPRMLTWTDDEVAGVERWRQDSTAEQPAVLQPVEDEYLIGGPDDVGRVGAETHIDDGGDP